MSCEGDNFAGTGRRFQREGQQTFSPPNPPAQLPKKRAPPLPFHWNTEHTSLALCKDEGWNTKDMYRWCQQSRCLFLPSLPLL